MNSFLRIKIIQVVRLDVALPGLTGLIPDMPDIRAGRYGPLPDELNGLTSSIPPRL